MAETRPQARGQHVTVSVHIGWLVPSYCEVLERLPCASFFHHAAPMGNMWGARPSPRTTHVTIWAVKLFLAQTKMSWRSLLTLQYSK